MGFHLSTNYVVEINSIDFNIRPNVDPIADPEVVLVQVLLEGVHLALRPQDAHPHAHAALQVRRLRKVVLQAVAAAGAR